MAAQGEGTAQARMQLSHGAERALSELRSRREHVKRKAMQDLRAVVEMEARQMSRESFSAFIQELNARIFTLIKSEPSFPVLTFSADEPARRDRDGRFPQGG